MNITNLTGIWTLLTNFSFWATNHYTTCTSFKTMSLSHRHAVASLRLFYKYFHGNCCDELLSLATRLASRSHPFPVEMAKCSHLFYSNNNFSCISHQWESLPPTCFRDSFKYSNVMSIDIFWCFRPDHCPSLYPFLLSISVTLTPCVLLALTPCLRVICLYILRKEKKEDQIHNYFFLSAPWLGWEHFSILS